jgi:hypothetical protein
VKAFNTIFARVLGAAPDRTQAQVLYAGDDAGAKAAERALIESAGFEAVDAGPLANARLLEPCGMLNIYFGYAAGRETGIALVWIPVAWAAIAASNVPSNQRPGAGWRPVVDFSVTYASGRWPSLASGGSGARGRAFESRRAH